MEEELFNLKYLENDLVEIKHTLTKKHLSEYVKYLSDENNAQALWDTLETTLLKTKAKRWYCVTCYGSNCVNHGKHSFQASNDIAAFFIAIWKCGKICSFSLRRAKCS